MGNKFVYIMAFVIGLLLGFLLVRVALARPDDPTGPQNGATPTPSLAPGLGRFLAPVENQAPASKSDQPPAKPAGGQLVATSTPVPPTPHPYPSPIGWGAWPTYDYSPYPAP